MKISGESGSTHTENVSRNSTAPGLERFPSYGQEDDPAFHADSTPKCTTAMRTRLKL